jgi:hypothetical protein
VVEVGNRVRVRVFGLQWLLTLEEEEVEGGGMTGGGGGSTDGGGQAALERRRPGGAGCPMDGGQRRGREDGC